MRAPRSLAAAARIAARRAPLGRVSCAIAVAVLSGLLAPALWAQRSSDDIGAADRLTLDAFVAQVLQASPRLRAVEAAAEAAAARIDSAGSLDDPLLSYAVAPRSAG